MRIKLSVGGLEMKGHPSPEFRPQFYMWKELDLPTAKEVIAYEHWSLNA